MVDLSRSQLEQDIDGEYKIATLIEEFNKDCSLPKEMDKLSNFNLGKGLLLNKWVGKYTRTTFKVKELKIDIEHLENKIKQKCRHDDVFKNNRIIDKHEALEKIAIDDEYVKLKRKLVRLETIRELLETYIEHFKYMNSQITNQIELIRFSTMAY